ncbi:MAG: primosomal protein [Firmicutes bacterium]|nr:primosomal protein [Bacillota bacterium]
MQRIAEIIINLPVKSINKPFTYLIPEEMEEVDVGWRVLVPFGGRRVEGFVASITEGSGEGLKHIIELLDEECWFTVHMMAVAVWISEFYLCTLAEAMRLFIPGKSGIKSEVLYRSLPENQLGPECAESERQLYEYLLEKGPQTSASLISVFGSHTEKLIRRLIANGNLERQSLVRKRAQAQYEVYWYVADLEAVSSLEQELARKPAQRRLLEILQNQKKLTTSELAQLKISRDVVKALAGRGIIASGKSRVVRDSYSQFAAINHAVSLTQDQQQVLDKIKPAIDGGYYQCFLLHGVTGSGKTQVYIEAAAAARKVGRQVVVLVPEIALTGQIVERFKEWFGDDVAVLHSKLSVGERFDTWQRLQSGSVGIAIGARSAVFAPVAEPGLFILDEEHEFTYKQEEAPHYHARQVAIKRAELSGAAVILGSATPSMETYFQAQNGTYELLSLSTRIDGAFLPEVNIVDMREELKAGRRSVISAPLRDLLIETIARGEQAIIVLNRRGYATFVMCRECGHVMTCNRCAVSLVYHHAGAVLRCHYCQSHQPVPDVCPSCQSRYIRFFGTGTQKVEEELAQILPSARIVRMDQDTTGSKTAHQRILHSFAVGDYDILLGTQMVAKGHDFQNVTAVGIISADTALNLPDFRAAEKTFALLTQAAGRAGRGNKPGRVVVQTYSADHYAITAGAKHDYADFYQCELKLRRELGYPPYNRIIKITVQGTSEAKARRLAEDTASLLNRIDSQGEIIGPFPAPVAKISEVYRMHILVKTLDIVATANAIHQTGIGQKGDISIDVDPLQVL